MNITGSSQQARHLFDLLQKALSRSSELMAELPRPHPAHLHAEGLRLELQQIAALLTRWAEMVDVPPAPVPAASVTSPADSRPALLYVDDKPERLELLQHRLEACGYRVVTALEGHDGMRKFLTHHVKLVILDYYMPSLDGGAVALQMRQLRSDVPIIIFSGALTLPDRVMAAIDGFISTSEEPNVLLAKIAELVPVEHPKAS